jgi:hypothetical protein
MPSIIFPTFLSPCIIRYSSFPTPNSYSIHSDIIPLEIILGQRLIQRRLASVNFFLGLVGVVQVSRIFMYNSSQKKLTSGQQIEAAKDSAVESAAGLKQDAIEAVKS